MSRRGKHRVPGPKPTRREPPNRASRPSNNAIVPNPETVCRHALLNQTDKKHQQQLSKLGEEVRYIGVLRE